MIGRPQQITVLRQRAGLSRPELARRIGVTGEAIRLIEAGRRRPRERTVLAIANVLGVDLADIAILGDPPGTEQTAIPA